jgi:integrase
MQRRGLVEQNPWQGQGTFGRRTRGAAKSKRPYGEGELVKLLRADPSEVIGRGYGAAIADLLRLGLLTGARLNELCELRAEDVRREQRAIRIREGKTENATRIIPVHDAVWAIVARRVQEAGQQELFPELKPGGPDRKRSWYVSKRFTEFRRRVLGEDDSVDFHSLRRTFATYLERASTLTPAVNASVIAELMGHAKQTLALNTYSGGLELTHLRVAVDMFTEIIPPDVFAVLKGARC